MPGPEVPETYRFGPFHLEIRERRLSRDGEVIALRGKIFDTLSVLVANAGRLLTKQQLLDAVWPETAVEENNLNHNVSVLRKALGESATGQQYIETVPRVGYRFAARVESIRIAAVRRDHAPTSPVEESGRVLEDEGTSPRLGETPGLTAITSIAVLPFADMSPSRDQSYLCEGLAEELINALTKVEGLRVAARTASFQFRSAGADVREIGGQLNVGALLEGSVRKADSRLRVTVQLIEVASGYHRWSQRFDRMLDDVFAVEDEIAERVATSLRGSVAGLPARPAWQRPQFTIEAYEYYLRGRQYLPGMTEPDLAKSAEMFDRAIELDPNYGPALACLGAVHATLYEWFGARDEDLRKAEQVTRRAMELAPELAESHTARGFVLSLSGRYEESAREFEQAIRLNPRFFEAYYYYARSSFAAGEIERSADLFRKAADARAEDFQSPMLLEQSLRMIGRDRDAREANREGIRRAERVLALNPIDGRALSLGSLALFQDGQRERAMEWSRRSYELYPDQMTTLVNAACLHARAGNKERALELIEQLFSRGWGKRDWVERDPDYDILRDEPRFKELVARLK